MQNNDIPAHHAMTWIRSGWGRLQREPARWLGMTLMFLVIALTLKFIPFFGNLLLVLISPIMLAGALLSVRSNAPAPAPQTAKQWARVLTVDALRELFQVFRREDHAFAIVIVCIVSFGLVSIINILELLITSGSVISGLTGANMAGPPRLATIFGMLVVAALYLLLIMALLYVVPLTLFGNRQPIPAVAESFRACLAHPKPLAAFAAPFLVLNIVILAAFSVSHWSGYLLLASFGILALPVFVIALQSSYHTIFEGGYTIPNAQTSATP